MPESLAADAAHASEGTPEPQSAPPVEGANSTDAPAPAPPSAETHPATGAEAAPPAAAVPAPRNRAEERIAELVSERNFYRDKALASIQPAAKPAEEPALPKGPPTLAEYEYDTDQWAQAHAKWTDEQIERRAAAIVERKLGETQQRSEAETLKQTWNSRCSEFEKTHPDFREVVFRDGLPFTETMVSVMAHSELGPAIAHHLGNNIAELTRISHLPRDLQAASLGRIEATLTQAPKPPAKPGTVVTRPPAPISPIAAASPGSKKLEDMSIDEYKANRPWAYSNR